MRGKSLLAGVAVLGLFAVAANAELYSFTEITSNSAIDLSGQLQMEVTAVGATQVKFRFTNNVGLASSITDVYFDDGTLLGIASIGSSSGVAFSQLASPGDLPGGGAISPPFVTSAGFSADSDPPTASNGVNASTEWVDIIFDLQVGQDFQSVIDALALDPNTAGALRVGLHMQALSDGQSESYVNDGHNGVIPIPGAALLGFVGLGMVGAIRRRLA